MPWPAIAAGIGAVSNIAGGFLSSANANRANKAAEAANASNQELQTLFATRGLEMRAQDAMRAYKKYGIHPLALLGVQGPSYTPSAAVFTQSGLGESIGRAGQDISRAVQAGADRGLRGEALKIQAMQLKLLTERAGLENESLKLDIASKQARLRQMHNPAVPSGSFSSVIPGQGETPSFWSKKWFQELPSVEETGYLRTPRNSLFPVPSKEAGTDHFYFLNTD